MKNNYVNNLGLIVSLPVMIDSAKAMARRGIKPDWPSLYPEIDRETHRHLNKVYQKEQANAIS